MKATVLYCYQILYVIYMMKEIELILADTLLVSEEQEETNHMHFPT